MGLCSMKVVFRVKLFGKITKLWLKVVWTVGGGHDWKEQREAKW